MKNIIPQKRINYFQYLITGLLLVASFVARSQTPAPTGSTDQYFCSATSWLNAGFTQPGDTFEELYIYGENLTFYEDNGGVLGNVIANPSTFVLVDGATYYVTQTINGLESSPLTITVEDRECGCFKNPDFETYNGQSDDSDYTIYHQENEDGYNTCSGSIIGLTPVGFSNVNATADGTAGALVGSGNDPKQSNISTTNASNPNSNYSFRLNDPTSGNDVAHMEKDFVAGEVISFSYAFVFEDQNHDPQEQPYVNIAIYDGNGDLFAQRCVITTPSDCILVNGTGIVLYSDWTCMKINTLDIIGGKAKLVVTAADCVYVAHPGYIYMDDFFVGDDEASLCDDPSFGYVAMEEFTASSTALDCVVELDSSLESCGANVDSSLPFPIEVCGTVKEPISNTNPASVQDLTIDLTKNGVLIGSLSNPVFNGDQFCFTITESDINISDAYGIIEISTSVEFSLDCGSPYVIESSDKAELDICPTAQCVSPLQTCDDIGTGFGTFDLTSADAGIRGTDWTAADVDIFYYPSEIDAVGETNVISSPSAYTNVTPYSDVVYARLEWHPAGTTTSCYYIMTIDLNVFVEPVLNLPSEVVICGSSQASVPLIATPQNIADLTDVSYSWRFNGDLLAFSGSYYEATEPGVYEITVGEANCPITKTVNVISIDYDIDLGADPLQLCGNGSTNLTATIIDNGSVPALDPALLSYTWSTGETTQTIEVGQSGVYTVEVDYNGECMQQESVDVVVATLPELNPLSDFEMCTTDVVDVTVTVNNLADNEVEFVWYKDGQVLANETSSTISVSDEGIYKVEVNEIGYGFCFTSEEFTADFYDNADCVISQGLSPDSPDGLNDFLDLKFLSERSGVENLKVYNRYGRIVFEKDDYVNSFAGVDNDGNDLKTGTYYYVIELRNEDPVFGKSVKGWVYINRSAN
ncbi:C-terminal domain of CHU protein family protein [Mesonia phycicola]|uniref:C-terminal domain of CHU protein family protein n=1 Tax=Mesonia phycicola TaxID=579105 RepID=A0A1M6G8T6_9FLAO|nr:gliding motility-associated C-terminal domain-containing protein [Mesonia phycicola]SHJ06383.1 C-terminal domain of CHU protein family protein [Mesonia phycicola]